MCVCGYGGEGIPKLLVTLHLWIGKREGVVYSEIPLSLTPSSGRIKKDTVAEPKTLPNPTTKYVVTDFQNVT